MIKCFKYKNFKSFVDDSLDLENFTTIIGTNGSGKSNAIEGIKILSEITTGLDISLVLDGAKSVNSGIRGGSSGCCRFNEKSFTLGCVIYVDDQYDLEYSITIDVSKKIYVLQESLYRIIKDGKKVLGQVKIFETKRPDNPDSGDIKVSYLNGSKGKPPDIICNRSSSVLPQMKSKIPSDTTKAKESIKYIEYLQKTLTTILFLDPVPSLMREYVRINDTELKPTGENISSVLNNLCLNNNSKEQFISIINKLPENEIQDIKFFETPTNDVMFTMVEKYGDTTEEIEAKRLSDGMLRCVSVLASVFTESQHSLIIVEEIDNGIHPSKVDALIKKLQELAEERHIDFILTTHNSSLLNNYSSKQLVGLSVVYRNKTNGASEFMSFIDIPDYENLLAMGGLGNAVINNSLIDAIKNPKKRKNALSFLEV